MHNDEESNRVGGQVDFRMDQVHLIGVLICLNIEKDAVWSNSTSSATRAMSNCHELVMDIPNINSRGEVSRSCVNCVCIHL